VYQHWGRGPAWHHVEQWANNPIEADHSRLKHRLRPIRGLQADRTAQVIIIAHAFMQNLRNGHYELAAGASPARRVAAAFSELRRGDLTQVPGPGSTHLRIRQRICATLHASRNPGCSTRYASPCISGSLVP
jgi:hypothetical protein